MPPSSIPPAYVPSSDFWICLSSADRYDQMYTIIMADANPVGTDETTMEQTRHWLVNGASLTGSAPYDVNFTGSTAMYVLPAPLSIRLVSLLLEGRDADETDSQYQLQRPRPCQRQRLSPVSLALRSLASLALLHELRRIVHELTVSIDMSSSSTPSHPPLRRRPTFPWPTRPSAPSTWPLTSCLPVSATSSLPTTSKSKSARPVLPCVPPFSHLTCLYPI